MPDNSICVFSRKMGMELNRVWKRGLMAATARAGPMVQKLDKRLRCPKALLSYQNFRQVSDRVGAPGLKNLRVLGQSGRRTRLRNLHSLVLPQCGECLRTVEFDS